MKHFPKLRLSPPPGVGLLILDAETLDIVVNSQLQRFNYANNSLIDKPIGKLIANTDPIEEVARSGEMKMVGTILKNAIGDEFEVRIAIDLVKTKTVNLIVVAIMFANDRSIDTDTARSIVKKVTKQLLKKLRGPGLKTIATSLATIAAFTSGLQDTLKSGFDIVKSLTSPPGQISDPAIAEIPKDENTDETRLLKIYKSLQAIDPNVLGVAYYSRDRMTVKTSLQYPAASSKFRFEDSIELSREAATAIARLDCFKTENVANLNNVAIGGILCYSDSSPDHQAIGVAIVGNFEIEPMATELFKRDRD